MTLEAQTLEPTPTASPTKLAPKTSNGSILVWHQNELPAAEVEIELDASELK